MPETMTPADDRSKCPCSAELQRIECQLGIALQLLAQILSHETGKPVDLELLLGAPLSSPPKGDSTMTKATGSPLKVPFFKSLKPGSKGQVMPGITLSSMPLPGSITLQNIDSSGNPVAVQPTDSVTGTVTSDGPLMVVSPGADTLHYVVTVPAGTTTGVVNLAGTETGTMSGNPVNFTSSLAVTFNLPSPLPVATDLQIILGS